ncbi:hypothetical protein BJ878DRAFT_416206, partial [Calycina marina]
ITGEESLNAATEYITKRFGKLDVLFNNAGVSGSGLDPGVLTIDTLTKTLNMNVIGTARSTIACLPLLRKTSTPRLVSITSRLGSITDRSDQMSP